MLTQFMQMEEVTLIRKRLKIRPTQNKEPPSTFKEEIVCLKLLHRLGHPNIVPLLGSYTYNGEHNFLFPCLDMDLHMFFNLSDRFGEFKWDFTFFEALRGLASALQNVHVLRLKAEQHGMDLVAMGYHHDLRPANILLTNKTFLLADFSLAKIKPVDIHSSPTSKTTWKAGAGDYISPECMGQDFSEQSVGRAIDIWAFGCLVTEIATYIERGPIGLQQFRKRRSSANFFPNWCDQYFFTKEGIRPAVLDWLQELIVKPRNELIPDLIRLALSTLQIDPSKRPDAAQICKELSSLSAKAHLHAIQDAFETYLAIAHQQGVHGPPTMKIVFEHERIRALGIVLGLHESQMNTQAIYDAGNFWDSSQEILLTLFKKLDSKNHLDAATQIPLLLEIAERTINLGRPFEEEIQSLVQSLVDMLPIKSQRRMEILWEQISLDTRDIDRLNDIEINCRSVGRRQYSEVGSLAAMKSLRLQYLAIKGKDSRELLLKKADVKLTGSIEGHSIGIHQNKRQVLVEWLTYSSKWKAMPLEQRTLLMELKAEGLGVKPKPAELRILDCLGFVEDSTEYYSYVFLYAFPDQYSMPGSAPLTTLFALLDYDVKTQRTIDMQPLLGAKFKLAAALVASLKELHMIGWLHENINSNNILLFGLAPGTPISSERLEQPYIVGFEKSRPDSDIWYTDGPSVDSHADYRHPDYNQESRFIPAYDYYSIGLVLLEIGLWTPLWLWSRKRPTATPEEFRLFLINTYVPRLGQKMGRAYYDAVIFCLQARPEDQDLHAGQVNRHSEFTEYIENVVEPLEELARSPL